MVTVWLGAAPRCIRRSSGQTSMTCAARMRTRQALIVPVGSTVEPRDDLLIKRHRTAVREIKHFSCRRHVPHGLRSLSKWHVSHKGKILAPTSTGFSPQISPQLWVLAKEAGRVKGRKGGSPCSGHVSPHRPTHPRGAPFFDHLEYPVLTRGLSLEGTTPGFSDPPASPDPDA